MKPLYFLALLLFTQSALSANYVFLSCSDRLLQSYKEYRSALENGNDASLYLNVAYMSDQFQPHYDTKKALTKALASYFSELNHYQLAVLEVRGDRKSVV